MFLAKDRHYSLADQIITHVDHALRTLAGNPLTTDRDNPSANVVEQVLTANEKRHVAGLMRVNHAGEVAAQGLYQGHALTARDHSVKQAMEHAAREENDHLSWCHSRITELGSHTSYLNPIWYVGSLLIGMLAGVIGDKWSLGFVEETERQVTLHLEAHKEQLPENDVKSAKIIAQMKIDEANHAINAHAAGAEELPQRIKKLMQLMAKLMTNTAYYI